MTQVTDELIHHTQYCGATDRTITDALATVRDVIAYTEHSNTPTCILSIDFAQAFDRVSHDYIFQILPRFGITVWFIEDYGHCMQGQRRRCRSTANWSAMCP
jgi:hypothetical protein